MTTAKSTRATDAKTTAPRHPAYRLWVAGRERDALAGATFSRLNPYDRSVAGTYANADAHDTHEAIAVARQAFDEGPWSRASARARYKVLRQAARILADNAQEVAEVMARESGKPMRTGLGEVGTASRMFEFYAGVVLDLEGEAISDRVENAIGLVLHEPMGVEGFITPWNFPILNPTAKIAPALAAGCTIVIKPSHLAPGATLLLARYLAEAGLPDGVLNVVTSDVERGAVVGQAIAASPLVDGIAFTGSTATGRAVMKTASSTNKRVFLELGGKSANVVFDDAPFDEAAAVSVNAFCFNSGQQCSAGTRLLAQHGIHDRLVDALVANTKRQVIGDPMDDRTTMGPIVNEDQHRRVTGYIALGRETAELVTGGGAPAGEAFANSLFVAPTIFDRVENTSRLAQEEIFGPVLSVIPFKTEADAIRLANDTQYGLAGGVWTNSIGRALRVAKGVRTGKMFVNTYNNSGIEDMPHGGYKDSGVGREQGRRGLEEFQQIKSVHIKIDSTTHEADVPPG